MSDLRTASTAEPSSGPAPSGTGCVDCLAGADPGWWMHLRRCADCGNVGCCDSSPSQHASAHFETSGHPIMQSFEPDEVWFWNFSTEATVEHAPLTEPTSHPATQPVPAPADKVPADWQDRLN